MSYHGAGPALVNGPPAYTGKTAAENTAAILGEKRKPTYYQQKRAWVILGYGQARLNRPSLAEFRRNVQALWGQLIRHDKSRDSRKARAYILDAMRTLGFRGMKWSTSSKMIHFTEHDGTFSLPTTGPGKGVFGLDDSHAYCQMEAPAAYTEEIHKQGQFETEQWQKYHRYQGFWSVDHDPDRPLDEETGLLQHAARYFRAIHVPEGPDSVWYALSYWVGGRRNDDEHGVDGPYISSPWVLKSRIWTYFVQTIRDSDHPRWRDYHVLNNWSERQVDGHGECSLLRSLYASRQQGRAGYSVWPGKPLYDALFLIVAD